MAIGLVGRKVGMTRIFQDGGESSPVTVLEISNNRITQVKSADTDGYSAVQLTTGTRRPGRVTKAMSGHFAKAGVEAGRGVWEFRASEEEIGELSTGSEIGVGIFEAGQMVDVQATSKGKGFAGGIKRHGCGGLRATHGVSISHRSIGSTGQNQTPGRVFKGKKGPGHMGASKRTIQNLEIVRVDNERNLILIKGSVPGSRASDVIIRPALKKSAQA